MVLINTLVSAISRVAGAALVLKAITSNSLRAAAATTTTLYSTSTSIKTSISTSFKCDLSIGPFCLHAVPVYQTTTIGVHVPYAYTTQTLGLTTTTAVPATAAPAGVGSAITTTLFSTSKSQTKVVSTSWSCALYFLFGTQCLYSLAKVSTITSTVPVTYAYTTQTITMAAAAPTSTFVNSNLAKPSSSVPLVTVAMTGSTPSNAVQTVSLVATSKSASQIVASSLQSNSLSTVPPSSFVTLTTPSPNPSSSSSPTTSVIPPPTCGLNAWAQTQDIGYYVDAAVTSYAGCMATCQSNANCLSFAISPSSPACIIYGVPVKEHTIADPASPYIYYEKDGSCVSSAALPIKTGGAYPSCPAGIVPFIYGTSMGTYTPCDSNPYSTCAQDVDGSAYCNTCGSCNNARPCTQDSDCTGTLGAGYACITGSACSPTDKDGRPSGNTGSPVCLYMLAGGSAFGCYGADSS